MTPIEQMAIKNGAKPSYTDRNDIFLIDVNQLEALREAIIKDFVNVLDPDCYVSKEYKSMISLGNKIIASSTEYRRFNTPLFDLSQWIDK